MKVSVVFIYKMTLLVRIVGGGKLTPYDSNCVEAMCACALRVCVCARPGVHAGVLGVQRCLRERTSDRATGPTARSRGKVDKLRIAEGRCQRGNITLRITPTRTGRSRCMVLCVSDISMQIK